MLSDQTAFEVLCQQWENERIKVSQEVYNQYAGFTVDENKRQKAAQETIQIAEKVLEQKEELPERLKLLAISAISYARSLPLRDALNTKRIETITHPEYRVATTDTAVNWTNWRQFNANSQTGERKAVYDEFLAKAIELKETVQTILQEGASIYQKFGSDPLSAYLYMENIGYDELHTLLLNLGEKTKSDFLDASEIYAKEVLEKEQLEYFDDMYLMRGKIYKSLNQHFKGIDDPLAFTLSHLHSMGFDTSRVAVDGEDRPGKHPSAICFSIQVPSDARILFKKLNPFSDLESVLHEFGHGLHGTAGSRDQPFWQRYSISAAEAETFSIWCESVLEYPSFLMNTVGLSKETIEDVLTRKRFMNLFFVVFYCALSLTKLEYWKKELTPEETAKNFEKYSEQFYFQVPGMYIFLHHVLPEYLLYTPSYVIAAIRAAELNRYLATEVGDEWWSQAKTAGIISEMMAAHGKVDFSEFSKLDLRPYLEDFCRIG
ncbi:MAG: hypothetical protein ACFFB3_05595 [Candidatus Hodarchaeota archaeon]